MTKKKPVNPWIQRSPLPQTTRAMHEAVEGWVMDPARTDKERQKALRFFRKMLKNLDQGKHW